MELLAIRAAIHNAYSSKLFQENITWLFESDCKRAVDLISNDQAPFHGPDLQIIQEICFFLSRIKSCKLCHIARQANQSADWLANFVMFSSECNL